MGFGFTPQAKPRSRKRLVPFGGRGADADGPERPWAPFGQPPRNSSDEGILSVKHTPQRSNQGLPEPPPAHSIPRAPVRGQSRAPGPGCWERTWVVAAGGPPRPLAGSAFPTGLGWHCPGPLTLFLGFLTPPGDPASVLGVPRLPLPRFVSITCAGGCLWATRLSCLTSDPGKGSASVRGGAGAWPVLGRGLGPGLGGARGRGLHRYTSEGASDPVCGFCGRLTPALESARPSPHWSGPSLCPQPPTFTGSVSPLTPGSLLCAGLAPSARLPGPPCLPGSRAATSPNPPTRLGRGSRRNGVRALQGLGKAMPWAPGSHGRQTHCQARTSQHHC
ncbi:uncharacterized protein LOC132483485 [Mesoplodon densirostris]|uniref:uncharacterized protein LOC132483485 n=1 Tax=Mesoplodon densirostris TaxID=48708 RepID=UPI0028DCBF8B|nr:uncharacterized protein LOC132483485 [Mesoplodon densirostris]